MQTCRYCPAIQTTTIKDGKAYSEVTGELTRDQLLDLHQTRKSVLDSLKAQDIDSETGEASPIDPDPGT